MPSAFEDVHDMRNAVEEKTLVWVDSSNREAGGSGSEYRVKLTEPLHNVVGLRIIESLIPATTLSIEYHNDLMVLHTVAYDDTAPVSPMRLWQAHTAGYEGSAWRNHDRIDPERTPYFDIGQDVEHHVVHKSVAVYSASPEHLLDIAQLTQSAQGEYVLCVFDGNVVSDLPETEASRAIYDPEEQVTVVSCILHDELMTYVSMVAMICGVYQIPHGKYDSLRDFTYELQHGYSSTKQGIKLDFIQPLSDKPERKFKLMVNPSLVWTDVTYDASGSTYAHTYANFPLNWCAMWLGSTCKDPLGFNGPHAPERVNETAGGSFLVSDLEPRYLGRMRATNLVNLASERYVWLRCGEIEQHMCSGIGDVLQKGIGVFKLDAPGVYKEGNTEFISVIPANFHPIGKLHQLSFKFELGSRPGALYDFKNVSHFMLLSIISLKADKRVIYESLPKQLNPDYEANSLMYQLKWDRQSNSEAFGIGRDALKDGEERNVVRIHNAALRGVNIFEWDKKETSWSQSL
jgi:hypothetical protein